MFICVYARARMPNVVMGKGAVAPCHPTPILPCCIFVCFHTVISEMRTCRYVILFVTVLGEATPLKHMTETYGKKSNFQMAQTFQGMMKSVISNVLYG